MSNCASRRALPFRTLALALVSLAPALAKPALADYFNGFEIDVAGWQEFRGTNEPQRVASGTNGVTSRTGGFHAEADQACDPSIPTASCSTPSPDGSAFTRFGGAVATFPPGGFSTSLFIYLDTSGGWATDTRFDWSVAAANTSGFHRRDFVFNGGFYTAGDATPPSAGVDRFIFSGSNNATRSGAFPANPAMDPFAITATGWYEFRHMFRDDGAGVLAVDLQIFDNGGTLLRTWTRSDPSDVIGVTVGGHRYGWIVFNEFSFLAIDDSKLMNAVAPPLIVDDDGFASASDCDDSSTPAFTTISAAVAAANPGDTIEVCPGTYSELVNVNKMLTILGPNVGLDARTNACRVGPARGPEAVVNGQDLGGGIRSTSFHVTAGGVVIDGFTVEGNSSSNVFGAGITLGAGISGSQVLNNVIQNNIIGLQLANSSAASPALIQRNLFLTNNNPGSASGSGIYSDEFVAGGALTGVVIDANQFSGQDDAAVNLSSTTPGSQSQITVSSNQMDGNGRGFFLLNVTSSSITGNRLSNSSFAASADIRIFGGVNGLSITGNILENGSGRAARVNDGFGGNPNSGITFSANGVQGYADANVQVDAGGYTGIFDASGNWWGTNVGAAIAAKLIGTVDYTPWLDVGTDLGGDACNGFQGDFSTLNVDDDSPQFGPVTRIQEGVNLVTASTVNVLPGLYEEQVVIATNNLNLLGAGSGTNPAVDSIIRSPVGPLPYSFTTSTTNYPVIGVHDCTGVLVDGLRIDGFGRGNNNVRFHGVAFFNAGGTLSACVVTGVRHTPLNGVQSGVGVFAFNNTGGPYTVNVSDCVIDDYQKNGMALSGAGLTANVSGCTTNGIGPTSLIAQNGIQVSFGAGGAIANCLSAGHVYTPATFVATGILIFEGTTVSITGTQSLANQVGIYYEDTDGSVTGCTVNSAGVAVGADGLDAINTGVALLGENPPRSPQPVFDQVAEPDDFGGPASDMTLTVDDSTFAGNGNTNSFGIYGFSDTDTLTLTLAGSTVLNWAFGVYADESGGTVNLTANNNAIYGNTNLGYFASGPTVQNAENNWWGAASGPIDTLGTDEAASPSCFDPATIRNIDGAGNGVTNLKVDYCPWLTSSPNADPPNQLFLAAMTCPPDTAAGTVTIELHMSDLAQVVTGFDVNLEFDTSLLTFVSGTYTSDPFETHIGGIAPVGNTIALNGAECFDPFPPPDPPCAGTTADALLATLVFSKASTAVCEMSTIGFVANATLYQGLAFEGNSVPTKMIDASFTVDAAPPVVTMRPADVSQQCFEPAIPPADTELIAATDGCGGSVTVAHVGDTDNGGSGCAGDPFVLTRTYRVTDNCGNFTDHVQTFTVEDTTAPAITCPADTTVECDGSGNGTQLDAFLNGASASDNCGSATLTHTSPNFSDGCGGSGATTVTWTAEDGCGLMSSCSATFTIVDTTPPTLSVPPDVLVNADAGDCTAVVDPGMATGSDVCSPPVTISGVRSDAQPLNAPYPAGVTTIIWNAEDACGLMTSGMQTVTVDDVNDVTATVVLDDVNLGAGSVTRCVKFIAKNGDTCAPPVHVSGVFTGSPATAVLSFEVLCGDWNEICAKDEQHTIFDTQPLTISGTSYTTPTPLTLLGGDTDNDSDIDIDDVTFLLFRFGLPDPPNVGCAPWSLALRGANFDDVGVVGSADYSILASNWQDITSCPCMAPQIEPPPRGVRTQVDAATLPADMAARADLNRDGRVDYRDVEELESRHHLGKLLSSKMKAGAQVGATRKE